VLCKAVAVTTEPTLAQLLMASSRSGILIPESLPKVATELLVNGVDSPALRELAGLDLSSFDFRDGLDLLDQAVVEMALAEPSIEERLTLTAALIAYQCTSGALSPRQVTRRFYSFAVHEDYPTEPPEIMEFYQLDDGWDSVAMEAQAMDGRVIDKARALLQRLSLGGWLPPRVIVDGLLK
jgi:hypothetical protein